MINKILRTIIGLPIVIILWPILIIITIVFFIIESLTLWLIKGKIDNQTKEEVIFILTIPYQFIKKIWIKKRRN